jgi:hypothetical protein
MSNSSEAAKAVVRRNTEEVQGKGNFDVFEELFADDFVGSLYRAIREAFPDCAPNRGVGRPKRGEAGR